jgi:G3E family GTPase
MSKTGKKRAENNELEANQVQVSSLIILTHLEGVSDSEKKEVVKSLRNLNPIATIKNIDNLDISNLKMLSPLDVEHQKMDHHKAHWSSCSVELPSLPSLDSIEIICNEISSTILRIKGVTKIKGDEHFTYFERTPDGSIMGRKYNGVPITGPMLVTIGPGSNPQVLEEIIESFISVRKV